MTNARNTTVLVIGLLLLIPVAVNGQELVPAQPQSAPTGYMQQGYGAPQTDTGPMQLSLTPPAGVPGGGPDQTYTPPVDPGLAAMNQAPPAGGPVAPPQSYTPQQLDQLLAPIALYPDPLISQILMASSYPLEIVEAQRWHANPQNAALTGPALQSALDQQPWDPSVKSLVAFPQVLEMMNNNLQWTEQLGDAFLASQPAVMDSIQDLRRKAEASGNLTSTPQQTVTQQQDDVVIQPTNPQVVYVPYYNPTIVYGTWPYAGYPPYYFPPPPGYIYYNVGLLGFGVGLAVVEGLWGWDHWDWHRHAIIVNESRFAALNGGRAAHFAPGGAWVHDVEHRHNVPYNTAAVRQQFQSAATQARTGYRGYFNTPQARTTENVHQATAAGPLHMTSPSAEAAGRSFGSASQTRSTPSSTKFNQSSRAQSPVSTSHFKTPAPQTQQRPAQTRAAPMFESFSRGSEVRTQSERGSYSRASMAPAAHATAAPQVHSGGSGGGSASGRAGGENRTR